MKLYVLWKYGNTADMYWHYGVFTIDKLEQAVMEYISESYCDYNWYHLRLPKTIEDWAKIEFDLHYKHWDETWSVNLYEVKMFE